MKDKQKFLRLAFTAGASVLLSILVVFVVVNAQTTITHLREDSLRVEGSAVLNAITEDPNNIRTGLMVPSGNVGLGPNFAITPPVYRLDVQGTVNAEWIRASGGRFDTVIVDSNWPTITGEYTSGNVQGPGNNNSATGCSAQIAADLCFLTYCKAQKLDDDTSICKVEKTLNLFGPQWLWEACATSVNDTDTYTEARMMCANF